jgi:TetR/AcrR family transcriptional repressor of nem operon
LRTLVGDIGLTHGAFYAHFPSRSDLIVQSIEDALQKTFDHLRQVIAEVAPEKRLEAFVNEYLSTQHRNVSERGCAVAALVSEAAREGEEVRRAMINGINRGATLVGEILPPGGSKKARFVRGRTIFAGMMGALQLARVASGAEAEAILSDARDAAVAAGHRRWPAA